MIIHSPLAVGTGRKKAAKKSHIHRELHHNIAPMASSQTVNVSLPSLPAGWSEEKDFKAVGSLSPATQRNIEPVGPHFLAHARRVCEPRLFDLHH